MKKKTALPLLIAAFLLPGVGAWWFLNHSEHVVSGSKSNYGTLIHPARPVADQPLVPAGNESRSERRLHRRWSLVFKLPGNCLEECRHALLMLYRVEQLMGKDSLRLQRIVLDDAFLPGNRGKEPLGLLWRLSKPESLEAALNELSAPTRIYLLDPLGNLMMRYPMDFDPRGMLKDLRKLFKASRIG